MICFSQDVLCIIITNILLLFSDKFQNHANRALKDLTAIKDKLFI